MDTTLIRLGSQVLLVVWCVAAASILLLSRRREVTAAGVRWAVFGLLCFGIWMFISALTIRDLDILPRSSLLWLFAAAELGTATGAWGWLVVYVRANFHFNCRLLGLGRLDHG